MTQRKRCNWCYGFCNETRPHISTYPTNRDRCPNCRGMEFELVDVPESDLPSEPEPVSVTGKQRSLFGREF